jgi:hypothetical protein
MVSDMDWNRCPLSSESAIVAFCINRLRLNDCGLVGEMNHLHWTAILSGGRFHQPMSQLPTAPFCRKPKDEKYEKIDRAQFHDVFLTDIPHLVSCYL